MYLFLRILYRGLQSSPRRRFQIYKITPCLFIFIFIAIFHTVRIQFGTYQYKVKTMSPDFTILIYFSKFELVIPCPFRIVDTSRTTASPINLSGGSLSIPIPLGIKCLWASTCVPV